MKNKKSPAEFLGAKVLSALDQSHIRGGMITHQQQKNVGRGQITYGGHIQQQLIENIF